MAKINVRYLTRRARADGTVRFFWQPNRALQKAGFKLERLPDDEAAAIQKAQALNDAVDQWRAGMAKNPAQAGAMTVFQLVETFKLSREYAKLSEKTRKDSYAYAFRAVVSWAGDAPVNSITPKAVNAFAESLRYTRKGKEIIETPARAAAIIRALRRLLTFAVNERVISINPASNPDIHVDSKQGRLWTPEEVRHFVKTADEMGYFSVGSAVMLNEWLGQRRGDIIKLLASAYRDGSIFIRQSKTRAEVDLPVDMIADLTARLQEQRRRFPDSLTLFPNENGKPMTPWMIRDRFEMIRTQACKTRPDMKDVVFMTLRHTAVTRLAEAGCDIPEIASITGHTLKTCTDILERYLIRTKRLAQSAFKRRQDHEAQSLFPVETPATEQTQHSAPALAADHYLKKCLAALNLNTLNEAHQLYMQRGTEPFLATPGTGLRTIVQMIEIFARSGWAVHDTDQHLVKRNSRSNSAAG